MTGIDDFHAQYVAALHSYLDARDEDTLAVGHELGRRALEEKISVLDIIEQHVRTIFAISEDSRIDAPVALEFLLQTLAPLDVATRGFLDGTKRYAEQRARAEDLADRDKFRTALVNSLQEGFFVCDHEGAVIEMNNAFIEILGYPERGFAVPLAAPVVGGQKDRSVNNNPASQPRQRRVRDTDSASRRPPRLGDGEHQCGQRRRHRPRRLRRHDA